MTDDRSKIPTELIVLSEAYNAAIASSNRAWLAAATLTVLAIGGDGAILGAEFTGYNFFAALVLALSAINLRLCSVQTNAYEAQWILHRYLRDVKASQTSVSKSVTLKDVAHRLSSSAYNRIFPILFSVREDARERIMNIVKTPFDTLYLLTPLIGMLIALVRCFLASRGEDLDLGGKLLVSLATVFVVIQIFVSITTLVHISGRRKKLSIEHDLK